LIVVPSSGPVTESNGFRAMIGAADVECSSDVVEAGEVSLGGAPDSAIDDGSTATLEATSCPMPEAWKYAARAGYYYRPYPYWGGIGLGHRRWGHRRGHRHW
jgi:hypothetical protein